MEVPGWHREILDERERLIAEGKARFIDWEEARRQIEAVLRGERMRRSWTVGDHGPPSIDERLKRGGDRER